MTGTSIVSSGVRGRALEMLALGIPGSQVAARLGVTDGMISQLLSDEDFAKQVEERRVAGSEKDQEFDELLERTEHQALENVASRVKFGNLQQSLQAFRILNGAKRRKDSAQHLPQEQGTAVQINMPVVLMPTYVMNGKSEIVEVDGQTMVSANPSRMNEIVKERTGHEVGLVQNKLEQAKQVLEGMVRSVVQPARRQARQVPSNLVDLL